MARRREVTLLKMVSTLERQEEVRRGKKGGKKIFFSSLKSLLLKEDAAKNVQLFILSIPF